MTWLTPTIGAIAAAIAVPTLLQSYVVFANPAAWPVPRHPGPTRRELLAALGGPDPTTEPSELANEGAA